MEPAVLRTSGFACRLCRSLGSTPVLTQLSYPSLGLTYSKRPSSQPRRSASSKASTQSSRIRKPVADATRSQRPGSTIGESFNGINDLAKSVLEHHSIPTEEETLRALRAVESAAKAFEGAPLEDVSGRQNDDGDTASALLTLDAHSTHSFRATSTEKINALSSLAYEIITFERVFISSKILSTYVNIQTLLERPATLPGVFKLYATKPTPYISKGSNKLHFRPQNPRAIATAIPAKLANSALDSAIARKDLPLALGIVQNTFRAPSFSRSKLFRRALPPATAAALAPFAAYSLASSLSAMQTGLPEEEFTKIAFAGILTYCVTVGTIGYVALTTSNDQMRRVTWAIGMPLWERWTREEERAACDRIAMAWGFKEKWRWGEEVGVEWHQLKDWLGYRGMVLDKVSLMEGME